MSNLICLSGKKIPLTYFLKISKLDEMVFPSTYRLSLFKGLFWVLKSRDGYVVVYDKEKRKVAGYVSFISLNEPYYSKMKEGGVVDVSLPIKALSPFKKERKHHLYCSSFATSPEYRNIGVFALLVRESLRHLERLAKQGIFADKILADAVSEEGKRLSIACGLTPIGNGMHNSTIYEGSFIPMKCKFPGEEGKRLMDLYPSK